MEALIIFIIDMLIPAALVALIAYATTGALRRKRSPKYYPDQKVLGQNYRTKNGEYEPVIIVATKTVWLNEQSFYHMYDCEVCETKNMRLELREDRIKPIEI